MPHLFDNGYTRDRYRLVGLVTTWLGSYQMLLTPTHIAVAEYRVRADRQSHDAASELSMQPGKGSANETKITRHNLLVQLKVKVLVQ